jgi:hypothetical protein
MVRDADADFTAETLRAQRKAKASEILCCAQDNRARSVSRPLDLF